MNAAWYKLGLFQLKMEKDIGAKVLEITHAALSRNLLFEPAVPFQVESKPNACYALAGWDEMCPTLAEASSMPRFGLAWTAPVKTQVNETALSTEWNIPDLIMERKIASRDNALEMHYRFINQSDQSIPFLWAGHIIFPVDGLLYVTLQGRQRIPGPGCDINNLKQHIADDVESLRIDSFTNIGKSWKFFVSVTDTACLVYEDCTLSVTTNTGWLGIFLNRGNFGPPCIGIEPTSCPTDSADESTLLLPGTTREVSWSLQVDVASNTA